MRESGDEGESGVRVRVGQKLTVMLRVGVTVGGDGERLE